MIRIAVINGKIAADFAARQPGRGGYLHPTLECADRFVASKVKEFRALRRKIDSSERHDIVAAIKERLAAAIKQRLDRNAKVE